jgi:CheY-like chemotaxis protein
MTIDAVVQLIDSTTKLLTALVWPTLVGVVALRFEPALKLFFENVGEFSLKGAGFEASAKRRQAEAAAALAAAGAYRQDPGAPMGEDAKQARDAVAVVAEFVTPAALRKADRARILWVDDRPQNNVYERQSLQALGVSFELVTSTDEALEKIKSQGFDVVISDMGRPSDPRAGYTLLSALRKSGYSTPFIIYAGSNAPEHKAEARERGALGSTNRASELFEYVMVALGKRSN